MPASSLICNIPFRRNQLFTGRESLLLQLHAALHPGKSGVLNQIYALTGLGGIGKTQTAVEYAYRFREHYFALLWMRAETREMLMSDICSIARLLDLPEHDKQDQSRIVEAVKQWLTQHDHWLLVLDNVEDFALVGGFLPQHSKGHVLLTTRAQATGTFAQQLDLEPMEERDGAILLLRRAKLLQSDTPLETVSGALHKSAKAISHMPGGLPLALDQAGAYIEETGCHLADYLERYQQHRAALLDLRGRVGSSHPLSVRATFSLCFEQIEQQSPMVTDILRLCAFLHPDAIPEDMLAKGISAHRTVYSPDGAYDMLLDNAIAALRTCSLLRRHHETRTVSLHSLVQAVVRDAMDEQMQRYWAEQSVHLVSNQFPALQGDVQQLDRWPECQACLPHALVAAELVEQWNMTSPEARTLLHRMGLYFLARADYQQAEMLLHRSNNLRLETLGELHADVAESLNALGDVAYYQGKYKRAETLVQRALRIREQVLEAAHPVIASTLSKLARIYQDQGKHIQAEPLLQRALFIYETSLGLDHLDVADVLNSLGFLSRRQGKLQEAEPLFQRALSIYEQHLGPDHPDVLFSLTYLASLWYDQGKYKQAQECYQRTLSMREQIMGPEHPHVATSLNDLARTLHVQGNYSEAELLFQRAVAIYKKTVGAEHPYVATSLTNWAMLYREMGRATQASSLLQQAKAIYEQTVGREHPRMAYCLSELARVHAKQGQFEQAEECFREALRIREMHFGRAHPKTRAILKEYLFLMSCQGRETGDTLLEEQWIAEQGEGTS